MARGGMGNIQQLMQQAQRMQQQMAQKQAELAEKTVTAQSGGGMVTATVNGAHELLELSIDPDVIDPEDKEMLEDMVVAAVNQAMQELIDDGTLNELAVKYELADLLLANQ